MRHNHRALSASLSAFQSTLSGNVRADITPELMFTVLQPWKLEGMRTLWEPLVTQYGADMIRSLFDV